MWINCVVLVVAASDPPRSVDGQVTDQNGDGVAKAVVQIGGQRATTTKGGNFTIEGLDGGSAAISSCVDGPCHDGSRLLRAARRSARSCWWNLRIPALSS